MLYRSTKFYPLFSVFFALLLIGSFFIDFSLAQAGLQLPSSPCDDNAESWFVFGGNIHDGSYEYGEDGTSREYGARAFQYGAEGNNDFLVVQDQQLSINFKVLFDPTGFSQIKINGFSANCFPLYGQSFGGAVVSGNNTVVYDQSQNRFQANGLGDWQHPPSVARYLWLNVWDGRNNTNYASYSYFIDVENPVNPIGVPDEPPPVETIDPVIIIPGILGSFQKNGQWQLDPISSIYENLVGTFEANGYEKGQDLFEFPYDWKNSNNITADILA